MKGRKGTLYIGTSGVAIPGNKTSFPAEFQGISRLGYYCSIFNSIEVNSSFYKIPQPRTFERWAQEVPPSFRFTIKLWKEITHTKQLRSDLDHIDRFLDAADKMGNKKGCLLIQFPGSINFDYFGEVERILERLSMADPGNSWQKAIEFRSHSWYVGETLEVLEECNAALVLHDIPKGRNSNVLIESSKAIYLRFHGPNGDYRGSYEPEILAGYAKNINNWLKDGKDVYAYFNNTMGSAHDDALLLRELVTNA